MSLQLDELLERQANNSFELETDFLKLNVNLLVSILFYSCLHSFPLDQ